MNLRFCRSRGSGFLLRLLHRNGIFQHDGGTKEVLAAIGGSSQKCGYPRRLPVYQLCDHLRCRAAHHIAAGALGKEDLAVLKQVICGFIDFHYPQKRPIIAAGVFGGVTVVGVGLFGIGAVAKEDQLAPVGMDGIQPAFKVVIEVFGDDAPA